MFLQEEVIHEDVENSLELSAINEDHKNVEIRKVSVKSANPSGSGSSHRKSKSKKFKDEESKRKWEEMMEVKRRKLFTSMVKKEVSKQQRSRVNKHKEVLIQCKRAALQCQKIVRNKAVSKNYYN